MMEEVLYGCDVMPSAIHITGSTLSGMRPNVGFKQSRLYTMPYGKQKDSTVKIGSLELLQASTALTLFNTSDPALAYRERGRGDCRSDQRGHPGRELWPGDNESTPFTRATNHEGAHADITNPAFAAFDATPTDQTEMGNRVNQVREGLLLPRQRWNRFSICCPRPQEAQGRWSPCPGLAPVGSCGPILARVQGDAGQELYRPHRVEHSCFGQRPPFVLGRYGHG